MQFYICRLVKLLILSNTSIDLSAISRKSSTINHHLSVIFTKQSLNCLINGLEALVSHTLKFIISYKN